MIAKVKGNKIEIKDPVTLVQGTVGQTLGVELPADWESLSVTAVFSAGAVQRDVPVLGGEITIPWEVLADPHAPLALCFHAAAANGQRVITTANCDPIRIAPSTAPSGQEPEAPSPSRADQIQALAQQALAAAQSVSTQAAQGAFNGRDGVDGTDGTDGVSPAVSVSEIQGGHRIQITDAAGSRSFDVLDGAPGEVTEAELETALASKADVNGSYDDMTVGNAKQLAATVGVTDRVPYNFRTSGGSADVGDRASDKIVGGTLVWNQMLENGNMDSDSFRTKWHCTVALNDHVATITPTDVSGTTQYNNQLALTTTAAPVVGHVYFATADYYPAHSKSIRIACFGHEGSSGSDFNPPSIQVEAGRWNTCQLVVKPTNTNSTFRSAFFVWLAMNADLGYSLTDADQIRRVMLIDLTQMFGAQIADHVYALEQATPGAGVAWFKKLFPKPYYTFNPGELISVKAAARRTVGFNAWDEEWETGSFDINGKKISDSSYIRSKNFIPVISNAHYYFGCPVWGVVYYFDADKVIIKRNVVGLNGTSRVFTTTSDCCFITFFPTGSYGTNYKNDICINLSWDGERDGEYAPYEENAYPLDDSLTLRGVPKLDNSGNLYFDGDTYESNGTVTRLYQQVPYQNGDELLDNVITDGTSTVKKLSSPVNEVAAPYQNPQIVDDFGTEEYIVPEQSGVAVPVGHETVYQANLRAKLEMAPESPDGDGDYIVRQTDGENRYVPLTIPAELPPAPSADGTYRLQITVTNGTPALSWGNA